MKAFDEIEPALSIVQRRVQGGAVGVAPSIFGFKRYSSPRTVQTYPPHQILTHAIESRLDRLNNRRRICDRSVVYIR